MAEWSEDTKRQTISDMTDKTYTPNGDKVYLKHISGLFGYMLDEDILNDNWCLIDNCDLRITSSSIPGYD